MGLDDIMKKPENEKLIRKSECSEPDYSQELAAIKASEEYKVLQQLQKKGIRAQDINRLVKGLEQGNPQKREYKIGKNKVLYGLISDTHVGNIHYDPQLMNHAAREFKKAGVDFVMHAGDIVDGWYQNRPASIFEQNAIGYDQQKDLAVKELLKLKKPLYFITGNHEYNTFMRNAGVEIGVEIERQLNNAGMEAHYLGNQEGDLKLKNGTLLRLSHPNGGTAYAISYKPQKIIESYEGGKKPNVLHIGNFHKAEYLFYRNVHAFQAACLEGQTKFMRDLGLPAHKGFWIIELTTNSRGDVDAISPKFFPSYQ